ncbi:hypothetical protein E2C01_070312 [Portunus trituberculatus]|uniref:Uncharacterized protein n=1 Tax=Portunus trituberculatus TaxID=210409 RepID=A0A5B7HWY7_PORTR|nr:hypothetical protein [Portunus trituberculatus]
MVWRSVVVEYDGVVRCGAPRILSIKTRPEKKSQSIDMRWCPKFQHLNSHSRANWEMNVRCAGH